MKEILKNWDKRLVPQVFDLDFFSSANNSLKAHDFDPKKVFAVGGEFLEMFLTDIAVSNLSGVTDTALEVKHSDIVYVFVNNPWHPRF